MMRRPHSIALLSALLVLACTALPARAADVWGSDGKPAQAGPASPGALRLVDVGPTGIAIKRPVLATACKACPWGSLALGVRAAMRLNGYDPQVCFVCWASYGPREVADRLKPIIPPLIATTPDIWPYVESPPDAETDFGITGLRLVVDAWNGTGEFAADNRKRQNYRVIAVIGYVPRPAYYAVAINHKSGIADLAQIKNRKQPTWIAANIRITDLDRTVLAYYGITEEVLKAHGGGFFTGVDRAKVAAADVYLGNLQLSYTPEGRMWYEATQVNNLDFVDLPAPLVAQLVTRPGMKAADIPVGIVRGVERPVSSVVSMPSAGAVGGGTAVYARDDVPDQFAYDVAKAIDEHRDLIEMQAVPFIYDPQTVALSPVIPMHPGALRYYRERGYVK